MLEIFKLFLSAVLLIFVIIGGVGTIFVLLIAPSVIFRNRLEKERDKYLNTRLP
jgi:ABC-type branched-subunit amino acid transport system permease subunit